MRGGCLSRRWNLAAQQTIKQKTTTVKTTVLCLPPPLVPDRLENASQLTAKSCGAWLKIPHQPKSCGSFQGGWSQWWRRRSQEGGGGEEAALEVLQRRPQWMRMLLGLVTNPTKTTHHQVLTAKLRLPNPLKTKTQPQTCLFTHSLSEVTLPIPRHISPLTCQCCEISQCGADWKPNLAWLLRWESSSSIIWVEEGEGTSPRKRTHHQAKMLLHLLQT